MPDLVLDWRLRFAAFDKLNELREARGGLVTLAELEAGFEFEGERIPFINTRRGIRRPRQLRGGPVCRLHHVELLDAAHILPDRDERGHPEIPNGLALCKIHHGAFDVDILGVSPDYRIAIRADVLDEIDGPMLRHGLRDMDGHSIDVPRAERLKPNKEYLAERFDRFRAA